MIITVGFPARFCGMIKVERKDRMDKNIEEITRNAVKKVLSQAKAPEETLQKLKEDLRDIDPAEIDTSDE